MINNRNIEEHYELIDGLSKKIKEELVMILVLCKKINKNIIPKHEKEIEIVASYYQKLEQLYTKTKIQYKNKQSKEEEFLFLVDFFTLYEYLYDYQTIVISNLTGSILETIFQGMYLPIDGALVNISSLRNEEQEQKDLKDKQEEVETLIKRVKKLYMKGE